MVETIVSEHLREVLELLQAEGRKGDESVEGGRARLEALARHVEVAPDVQLKPVKVCGMSALWIQAPESDPERVILYLHGGSYCYGSLTTHRELVSRVARASRAKALLIAYRLAPEHPFPAAIEDATAAYRWLVGQVRHEHLAVVGESAGGGLTLATLLALRDAGDPLPAAAVCMSPWTDLACTGESMQRNAAIDPMCSPTGLRKESRLYLGAVDPHHPLASPLYGDLHGLPPLLIQVGTAEVILDDSLRLAERARAAGVDVELQVAEGTIHGWQAFASRLTEGQEAIERVGRFVRQHTPTNGRI